MRGAPAPAISAHESFIAGLIGTTLLAGSAFAQGIVLTNTSLIDGSGAAMQRGVWAGAYRSSSRWTEATSALPQKGRRDLVVS